MPFRSRGRFRGQQRRRRGMDWISAGATGSITLTAGQTALAYIVLPSQLREQFTDPTLRRTRGVISFESQATTIVGAVGIIRWADPNDTVPSESVPNPYSDPDLDWLWHRYLMQAAGATSEAPHGREFEIDSKAMRKIGSDHGILFVAHNAAGSSSSYRFAWGARCLFSDS